MDLSRNSATFLDWFFEIIPQCARHTDRQAGRQAERQTDRQLDRQSGNTHSASSTVSVMARKTQLSRMVVMTT